MSEPSSEPRTNRRWLLWGGIGAGVAVVAVAAIVIGPLLTPASAPTPSPSLTTDAGPTPTPSPTATPTCTVGTVDATWTDTEVVDLPADGDLTATEVFAISGLAPRVDSSVEGFVIDDRLAGVVVRLDDETASQTTTSHLTVVDRESGVVSWTTEIAGSLSVVSTPRSTGVDGILVVSTYEEEATKLLALDLADGERRGERSTDTPRNSLPTYPWNAELAPAGAEGFFVTDYSTLFFVSATTLDDVWSASGEEYGVGAFEGGVPFYVAGEVAFVGSHALDAATGAPLGWESAGGWVFPAAGAVVQLPLSDALELLPLSGLDTSTGDSCWSREVWSAQTWADDLWVISEDHAVEKIDPRTGETLAIIVEDVSPDAWLEVAGGRLVLVESSDAESPRRFFDGGEEAGTLSADDVVSTSDQLISIADDGAIVARTFDGVTVWRYDDGQESQLSHGIALNFDHDADRGSVTVALLH